MMQGMTFVMILGNLIGALLTFVYFHYINMDLNLPRETTSSLNDMVFFVIGTAFIFFVIVTINLRWSRPLHQVIQDENTTEEPNGAHPEKLRRKALQLVPVFTATNLFAWMMAGFIFGVLSPVIRDEILSGRIPLDGEMTRATLLFSDLRDFTPFVESTHPKQVVSIMNQYFSEMAEAIKRNNGLILQYVGDEIEAVFGAPVPNDDHPDMAASAALEMKRRLVHLNERLKTQGVAPFRHGIGIHTGAVLAGIIGSKERSSYALVGDTVNLASRIQGLTKEFACDIILSQTTHDLVAGAYQMEPLRAVRVKGKSQEILTYKLLSHIGVS